ncbi:MAG: hypothetical protein IIV14_05745 [Bacteroidaceae bacterium]|nr:hypothetical protein [Bacteroidaceae bacterium]
MGYYSNLAIEHIPNDHDCSYTSAEMQLLWRLDALEERYHELTHRKTGRRDEGEYFSEDNLRYVLPEHFFSAANVRKAIDLAIKDLKERYDICVGDEPVQEAPVVDEITDMQVSFLDMLALQTQGVPLSAA